MPPPRDATQLLQSLSAGDPDAPEQLMPVVYDELRELAADYLKRERAGHTLQPTALVHEAYVRLVDQTRVSWKGRAHFCGIAARVMRQILVDHARHRGRAKRRPPGTRVPVDLTLEAACRPDGDVMAVDEALNKLARTEARKARVVELRFFGGLDVDETAEVLGVSARTVAGDWAYAKAWLFREVTRT